MFLLLCFARNCGFGFFHEGRCLCGGWGGGAVALLYMCGERDTVVFCVPPHASRDENIFGAFLLTLLCVYTRRALS